jgi:hypothetical protein
VTETSRRWLPVIAIAAPLLAVVVVMVMFLQTPDPQAPPPDQRASIIPVIPSSIDRPREPGPIVEGSIVDTPPFAATTIERPYVVIDRTRVVEVSSRRTVLELPPGSAAASVLAAGDARPTLVIADRKAQVFAIADARVEPVLAFGDRDPVRLWAAPARRLVAIAHRDELVVYDLDRHVEVLRHLAPIGTVVWHPQGTQLAVTTAGQTRVFDVP